MQPSRNPEHPDIGPLIMVREATADDLAGMVNVRCEIYQDYRTTVEKILDEDRRRAAHLKHCRLVAVNEHSALGYATLTQYQGKYAPGKFFLSGGVLMGHRSRGIGSLLFDRLLFRLKEYGATELCADAREDWERSLIFLNDRGFREYRREYVWELPVDGFDFEPYRDLEEQLQSGGIVIRTLRELESDPDRDRKLYDLDWEVTRDEPGSDDDTQVDFETFVREGLNAPQRLPDGYFVAVHGKAYVGVCLLNDDPPNNVVHHGITGVTRPFRRRGVATALKVRAIRFAQHRGVASIRTDNEIGNVPMLTINRRLGFQKLPGWIFVKRRCSGHHGDRNND